MSRTFIFDNGYIGMLVLAVAALICVIAGIVLAVTNKGSTYKMAGTLLAVLGLAIVVFLFKYGDDLMRQFG